MESKAKEGGLNFARSGEDLVGLWREHRQVDPFATEDLRYLCEASPADTSKRQTRSVGRVGWLA